MFLTNFRIVFAFYFVFTTYIPIVEVNLQKEEIVVKSLNFLFNYLKTVAFVYMILKRAKWFGCLASD